MLEMLGQLYDKFWASPVPAVCVAVIILAIIYFAYVKKEKMAEAIVKTVVKEYLDIAASKGVTVEIFVDNLIARAVKKVKETPDKTDALVLAFLQSSLTRNKMIEIIKKQVSEIAGNDAILQDGVRPTPEQPVTPEEPKVEEPKVDSTEETK